MGLVQASQFKIWLTLLPHLQLALFLLAVDAGQVHAVEPAVLLRLVPVSLIEYLIFNISDVYYL